MVLLLGGVGGQGGVVGSEQLAPDFVLVGEGSEEMVDTAEVQEEVGGAAQLQNF